jgi:hypothetical protein
MKITERHTSYPLDGERAVLNQKKILCYSHMNLFGWCNGETFTFLNSNIIGVSTYQPQHLFSVPVYKHTWCPSICNRHSQNLKGALLVKWQQFSSNPCTSSPLYPIIPSVYKCTCLAIYGQSPHGPCGGIQRWVSVSCFSPLDVPAWG